MRLPPALLERDGLARLSAERVRQEMLRLLVAPRGPELVRPMLDYGLLPAGAGLGTRGRRCCAGLPTSRRHSASPTGCDAEARRAGGGGAEDADRLARPPAPRQ